MLILTRHSWLRIHKGGFHLRDRSCLLVFKLFSSWCHNFRHSQNCSPIRASPREPQITVVCRDTVRTRNTAQQAFQTTSICLEDGLEMRLSKYVYHVRPDKSDPTTNHPKQNIPPPAACPLLSRQTWRASREGRRGSRWPTQASWMPMLRNGSSTCGKGKCSIHSFYLLCINC